MAYLHGEFPEYPERILEHNLAQVQARFDFMAQDEQDPVYLRRRLFPTAESRYLRRPSAAHHGCSLSPTTMGAC